MTKQIALTFLANILVGSIQAGSISGNDYTFAYPDNMTGLVKFDDVFDFSWPEKRASFLLALHNQQDDSDPISINSLSDKLQAEAINRIAKPPVGEPNIITSVETNTVSAGIFTGYQYVYSADNPLGYKFNYFLYVLTAGDSLFSGVLSGLEVSDSMKSDVQLILKSGTISDAKQAEQ
jgi:hypothetical protein